MGRRKDIFQSNFKTLVWCSNKKSCLVTAVSWSKTSSLRDLFLLLLLLAKLVTDVLERVGGRWLQGGGSHGRSSHALWVLVVSDVDRLACTLPQGMPVLLLGVLTSVTKVFALVLVRTWCFSSTDLASPWLSCYRILGISDPGYWLRHFPKNIYLSFNHGGPLAGHKGSTQSFLLLPEACGIIGIHSYYSGNWKWPGKAGADPAAWPCSPTLCLAGLSSGWSSSEPQMGMREAHPLWE